MVDVYEKVGIITCERTCVAESTPTDYISFKSSKREWNAVHDLQSSDTM